MTSTTAFCLFLTRHLVASRHLFSVFVCLSACSSYKNCDTCVPHAKVRLSAVVRVYAINQTSPNLCSMQQTCYAGFMILRLRLWRPTLFRVLTRPHERNEVWITALNPTYIYKSANHSLSVFWSSFCCYCDSGLDRRMVKVFQ